MITYYCSSWYTLVGNEIRTCEESGTWTGSDPSCVRGIFMLIIVCIALPFWWYLASELTTKSSIIIRMCIILNIVRVVVIFTLIWICLKQMGEEILSEWNQKEGLPTYESSCFQKLFVHKYSRVMLIIVRISSRGDVFLCCG